MTTKFDQQYFNVYGEPDGSSYAKMYKKFTVLPKHIKQVATVPDKPRVLDVGAADGRLLRDYHTAFGGPETNYCGVEISTAVLPIFGTIKTHDVTSEEPFPFTGKFDIIIVNVMMYLEGSQIESLYRRLGMMLTDNGILATTIFSSWEFGTLTNDEEEWEDAFLTAHYLKGKFVDEGNHNNVTFAAPPRWWVNAMTKASVEPDRQFYGDDIMVHRRSADLGRPYVKVYPSGEMFPKGKVISPFTVHFITSDVKIGIRLALDGDVAETDGYLTSSTTVGEAYLREIVKLVEEGWFGPVRKFKFKVYDMPYVLIPSVKIKQGYAVPSETS